MLALGNSARLDFLPGLADHGLPLKTAGDAMHIRNTVLRRQARIELESDTRLRQSLGHFIVIGGFGGGRSCRHTGFHAGVVAAIATTRL